jgi:hypothetical protein
MPDAILSGGDKLKAALDEIARELDKGHTLRVGFLGNASYPDGTSVALVAAINEFGAPSRGQPPRPFFRRMIAAHSDEWPNAIAANLKATGYDVQATLQRIGAGIAGQLRDSIVSLVDPPLAPSTIQKKGFEKPLIDTGVLIQAVDYEIS